MQPLQPEATVPLRLHLRTQSAFSLVETLLASLQESSLFVLPRDRTWLQNWEIQYHHADTSDLQAAALRDLFHRLTRVAVPGHPSFDAVQSVQREIFPILEHFLPPGSNPQDFIDTNRSLRARNTQPIRISRVTSPESMLEQLFREMRASRLFSEEAIDAIESEYPTLTDPMDRAGLLCFFLIRAIEAVTPQKRWREAIEKILAQILPAGTNIQQFIDMQKQLEEEFRAIQAVQTQTEARSQRIETQAAERLNSVATRTQTLFTEARASLAEAMAPISHVVTPELEARIRAAEEQSAHVRREASRLSTDITRGLSELDIVAQKQAKFLKETFGQ